MTHTLIQIGPSFLVLALFGLLIVAAGWWATLRFDDNDGWLFGEEQDR